MVAGMAMSLGKWTLRSESSTGGNGIPIISATARHCWNAAALSSLHISWTGSSSKGSCQCDTTRNFISFDTQTICTVFTETCFGWIWWFSLRLSAMFRGNPDARLHRDNLSVPHVYTVCILCVCVCVCWVVWGKRPFSCIRQGRRLTGT